MTKLETTIRQVSDLLDFYMKIKKEKSKNLRLAQPGVAAGLGQIPYRKAANAPTGMAAAHDQDE